MTWRVCERLHRPCTYTPQDFFTMEWLGLGPTDPTLKPMTANVFPLGKVPLRTLVALPTIAYSGSEVAKPEKAPCVQGGWELMVAIRQAADEDAGEGEGGDDDAAGAG